MVYKAVQAYLADKAQAFLPGNSFYPEEDKYASQFDPWSIGHRAATKPWINISVNIQIGFAAPDASNTSIPQPSDLACKPGSTANSSAFSPDPYPRFDGRSQEPPPQPNAPRGAHQAAFERILGHAYGSSTVKGGWNHFGDVHNHYTQTQVQAHSQITARRNSDSVASMSRSTAFFASLREANALSGGCVGHGPDHTQRHKQDEP